MRDVVEVDARHGNLADDADTRHHVLNEHGLAEPARRVDLEDPLRACEKEIPRVLVEVASVVGVRCLALAPPTCAARDLRCQLLDELLELWLGRLASAQRMLF